MKVGVFSVILGSLKLEKALDYFAALGVQSVELGAGAFAGQSHCPVDALLKSPQKVKDFLNTIHSRGLSISALNCPGNTLHPDKRRAKSDDADFRKALQLAETLGVDTVINFSGCPGGAPGDKTPNWVTCPWPPDFLKILEYQWNRVVLPYWSKTAAYAKQCGIRKIAFEMHPGFVVYNPETLLRLRKEVGSIIGANFDPSHLFWQGINPCEAVRALAGAIWHVHAKDTAIHEWNSVRNGVLDTKHYKDELNRAWIFRTVGYGHPRHFWCDFVSALRMTGYDGTLSVEHEDSLMTTREGLEKGIRFLQSIVLTEPKGNVTWA
ncbi:MAG TPA: sugar phosphate isomerase/epimerase [Candidatus Saccharimonadales bacterium]|nr:sugar phosphate isomerase/epimerase [Candidatus Saccharimonadales bacterium]